MLRDLLYETQSFFVEHSNQRADFSACAANDPGSLQIAPTPAPTVNDACDVVDRFLKAWEANDYPTMYGLISGKSKENSQTQFAAAYQQVEKQLDTPGKSHTLDCGDAQLQGTTAAITYDMTFKTSQLGEFTDPKRTMRLVWTAQGWRVAWSTMDIFDGMAGGATLSVDYTPASRGIIYDRNGKPFVQNNQALYSFKLLTAKYPKTPDDCFAEIATLFKRKFTEVQAAYKASTGLQYGYVIGHMDQATFDAKSAELNAVCPVTSQKDTTSRVYFANGLASQTIGFVGPIPGDQANTIYAGYPPSAIVGREGIEQVYQKQLAGTSGALLTIRLPDGQLLRTIAGQQSKPSQDVKLTLDRDLQAATEQIISDAYNDAAPSWGQFSTGTAAIVMDVRTGQILAIASYPTFDVDVYNPNTSYGKDAAAMLDTITNPKGVSQRPALTNLVTSEYSAMGSVFKIVSMAAATDSGTFKPTDTYLCTGKWDGRAKFGDSLVRNDWIEIDPGFKDVGNQHGLITLTQALTSSCDAYFWEVGGTLNKRDPTLLSKYALQMGLGSAPGFTDIPNSDLPGQIPSPANIGQIASTQGRSWDIGDALNEVIGQGNVKVTPLQVARMMVAVANGGTLYKPYLVMSVGTADKTTYTAQPQAQGNININLKDLQSIQEGLCNVTQVKIWGTAQWFMWNWDFSRIMVCAKTGTAQTGTAHPNGWFAAYAGPTGKPPEIAIVALVEHGREGSETAGPIVRRMIEAYYHIPYNGWPPFFQQPYVNMANPDGSDGGRH